MDRRKIYFYFTLVITLSSIVLLATGSKILTVSLDKNQSIPLGTFITWGGMISLPLTIYWGIKDLRSPKTRFNRLLAGFLRIIIILGILWAPLSYLLAGNLKFSFSEKETFQGGQIAMQLFWYLSYGIPIGALITLVTFWLSLLAKRLLSTPNDVN